MAEASFSTLDWRSSHFLNIREKNATGLFPWFKEVEIASVPKTKGRFSSMTRRVAADKPSFSVCKACKAFSPKADSVEEFRGLSATCFSVSLHTKCAKNFPLPLLLRWSCFSALKRKAEILRSETASTLTKSKDQKSELRNSHSF